MSPFWYYGTASIFNQGFQSDSSADVDLRHDSYYIARVATQCIAFSFPKRIVACNLLLPRAGVFERRSAPVLIWRDTPDFIHG
jgi:hypothetical protein